MSTRSTSTLPARSGAGGIATDASDAYTTNSYRLRNYRVNKERALVLPASSDTCCTDRSSTLHLDR